MYLKVSSLPLKIFISENANGNDQKLFYMLIAETSNMIKQFASLSNLSLFEEQTLTKLEMICINLIFSSKINEAENLQLHIPIDSLQTSAALCLVALYKNSTEQRSFLLHEVLAGFSLMNTKKGVAKTSRQNVVSIFIYSP